MTTFEIVYIIMGIVVFAVVAVLVFVFRKKKNGGSDFEKFVVQTTNNLSAIDRVLSNFNDRLEKLENDMQKYLETKEPEEEPRYIQTKYYAYEKDGKIIIEVYKNSDVKVILPAQNSGQEQQEKQEQQEQNESTDYKSMLLEKLKTPMSWQDIVALKIPNITQLVSQLKKEGLVTKNEKGLYVLVQGESKKV